MSEGVVSCRKESGRVGRSRVVSEGVVSCRKESGRVGRSRVVSEGVVSCRKESCRVGRSRVGGHDPFPGEFDVAVTNPKTCSSPRISSW